MPKHHMEKKYGSTPTLAERIATLPKWAQDHIQSLNRNSDEMRARLDEHPESPVSYRDHRGAAAYTGDVVYLPPTTIIEFRIGDADWETIRVSMNVAQGHAPGVSVHGGSLITISPEAGNAVVIRPEAR